MTTETRYCNGCELYYPPDAVAAFRDTDNYDDAYYCVKCLQEIIANIPNHWSAGSKHA